MKGASVSNLRRTAGTLRRQINCYEDLIRAIDVLSLEPLTHTEKYRLSTARWHVTAARSDLRSALGSIEERI